MRLEIKEFFDKLEQDALSMRLSILEGILNKVQVEALGEIAELNDLDEVKDLQNRYFSKKGLITELLKYMGKVSGTDRPILGKVLHELKESVEKSLNDRLVQLEGLALQEKLQREVLDVTLPGKKFNVGHKHPLTIVEEEIRDILGQIGFTVVEGYEIEEDHYNFERLNIPKDHPAREMQDTFYLNEEVVLRTHTSPVQARIMDELHPNLPVKIIAPGKVFRRDDDSTHSPMFHQIEGLLVDKNITFADLKGTLLYLVTSIFGDDRKIRLRPSYFPFTEPSAEVDVSCGNCNQEGCRVCGYTGWLEILGSGMVHPKVLEMAGYDPNEVTGFAFGLGIERIAMLKYGIDDMRLLFDNDLRFLTQF